jgi:hypothetical protein
MKRTLTIIAAALLLGPLLTGCGASDPTPPKPCELREITGYQWTKIGGWWEYTWTLCVVSEKRLATPFKGESQ